MKNLTAAETITYIKSGARILDLRPAGEFVLGFVARSVFLPMDDSGKEWLSFLDNEDRRIALVTENGRGAEAAKLFQQTGLVEVAGVLDAGEALLDQRDLLIDIPAEEFALDYEFDEFYLLDVRNKEDYDAAHLEDAESLPLAELEGLLPDIDSDLNIYIYGETFEQACFAGSLFKRNGFNKIRICSEGFSVLRKTKIPVVKAKKKSANQP